MMLAMAGMAEGVISAVITFGWIGLFICGTCAVVAFSVQNWNAKFVCWLLAAVGMLCLMWPCQPWSIVINYPPTPDPDEIDWQSEARTLALGWIISAVAFLGVTIYLWRKLATDKTLPVSKAFPVIATEK